MIDEPRWWHRGRRWSHLVSDHSVEELHRFAADAGIPVRGFHGDHYDVPEEWYANMIARGAQPADSRTIVRRLHAAGLRTTAAQRRADRAGRVAH